MKAEADVNLPLDIIVEIRSRFMDDFFDISSMELRRLSSHVRFPHSCQRTARTSTEGSMVCDNAIADAIYRSLNPHPLGPYSPRPPRVSSDIFTSAFSLKSTLQRLRRIQPPRGHDNCYRGQDKLELLLNCPQRLDDYMGEIGFPNAEHKAYTEGQRIKTGLTGNWE